MTATTLVAGPELAAARAAWADPFCETRQDALPGLICAAPVGTAVGSDSWLPELVVAQAGNGEHGRWVRLTADGLAASPGQWCRCRPPPDDWAYYETWDPVQWRTAHGWVHAHRACRRLVQSG